MKPQKESKKQKKMFWKDSFRLVRSKDVPKRPKPKNSWQLMGAVAVQVKQHWRVFFGLSGLYALLYVIFVEGFSRIDLSLVRESLGQAGVFTDPLSEAGVLTASVLATDVSSGDSTKIVWANILAIIFGLFFIWAARQIMAGHKIKIRDALYNGTTPLPAVVMVILVIFVQTLPLLVGIFLYLAAQNNNLIVGGVEAMVLFIVALLGGILTLYWICSSLIGLVAATLPGIYPFAALRAAKELVLHRRQQVFIRILTFAAIMAVAWILIIMLTVSNRVTGTIMNEVIIVLRTLTLLASTLYLYHLYRSLIETDDEQATSK